jgi:spore maturation protein CgeB
MSFPGKIKRILFFGKSKKRTQTTRFLRKAFENQGIKVKFIKYRKLEHLWGKSLTEKYILSTFHRFKPHLVFINTIDIPFRVLAQISGKTKIAIYYPDYTDPFKEEMIERGRLSDYFFITNQGQIPYLKKRGVKNPTFILEGVDDNKHRIIKSKRKKWKSEVAFIGRPSDPFRIQLLQKVDRKFHLKVWGGEWSKWGFECLKKDIYPKDFAKICSGAKIMLGIDATDQVEGYFSNRTWITLGCGGFLLTRYVPGLENTFTYKKHLVWYRDINECLNLISEYLDNEAEREMIREEGYRFVHENYTFDHMVRRILAYIEK